MRVPVVGLGQGFVEAVVEVAIVGEDDMSSNVEQLEILIHVKKEEQREAEELTKPSGVTSVDARPPGVVLESTMSHDAPFFHHKRSVTMNGVIMMISGHTNC